MKKILCLFFILHVTAIVLINLSFFTEVSVKPPKTSLNRLGQFFFYSDLKQDKFSKTTCAVYASYIGASRCYEFFSPNVSLQYVQFSFVSDKNINLGLLKSNYETDVKEDTFNYLFAFIVKKQDFRDKILRSIADEQFNRNAALKFIKVQYTEGNYASKKSKTGTIYTLFKD